MKSRKARDEAAYAVSVKNQTRVRDAALRFLQEKPDYQNMNMRFDVILIHDYNEIDYLENAF